MTQLQLVWLAGLLEGEGSFMVGPPSEPNRPRISVSMTDHDIVERAAQLMGTRYIHGRRDKRNASWKPYFMACLRGKRGVKLMQELRPHTGKRRRQQIDKAVASYTDRRAGDNSRKLSAAEVRSIRRRLRDGEPILRLAHDFTVSRATVKRIRDKKTWRAA